MPKATEALFKGILPGVRVVEACDLSLLGAPVDIQGITGTINEKREALERMTSKLEVLNLHQAFVSLKNAFAISRLQYVPRISPAYLCREELRIFDRTLFGSLGRVTNVSLEGIGNVCKQAGFPVNFGGLGCRRAEDIALPSFLASMYSVGELVETILSRINIADTNELAEAVESWRGPSVDAPLPDDKSRQKAWDLPIVERNWENMLRVADQVCRARLLATAQRERESGAWLNALPVSSLGTLLDSESFRVVIVGADVCIPHSCRCGGRMDSRGMHGLSCRYSAGRFSRHSAMNDVVKRTLHKALLPSVLEPPGLDRGDGSRPGGIIVFPFSGGKSLVWDRTFAGVHLNRSAMEAGISANSAEERKRRKYAALAEAHQFETMYIVCS